LVKRGIKKGDVIGVAIERSTDLIVAILGIIKSGAVYVPLDPQFPKGRLEYMLEDSEAKCLLISKKYKSLLSTKVPSIILEDIPFTAYENTNFAPVQVDGNDLV